ncbi:MAG: RecQ family ATP-dependent DNA helicase [Victivallaceae bacterium]|nr:RecQ family ATP-dependent DNA helicase [Victivallaceae bacterium]
MNEIYGNLKKYFGFEQFRPGQEQVINSLMNGHSALAIFPTGGGKSLCYQLPALSFKGITLVVTPLIALMKDQIDYLQSCEVPAIRLDSSLSIDEYRQAWNDLKMGKVKLLYVSPERFSNERFVEQVKRFNLSMMVIDEAHCISEWGHNFRPDYLKLPKFARQFNAERVLALTATANPSVANDIQQQFNIGPDDYVNTGFYRSNLNLQISIVNDSQCDDVLLQRLKERPAGATIIYTTLQKTTESVAGLLGEHGIIAKPYHAGMNPEERHSIQEWFMQNPQAVVVATIAFGMGIDKADIRYVYHYNLPKSLENYMQETGRAGRDGFPAICETLARGDDMTTLENFTYADTPEPESIQAFVEFVLQQEQTFDISEYELAYQFDIRSIVISTLFCYLELEGIIESIGSFYSTYRYQLLMSEQEIMGSFNPNRIKFLQAVFNSAKKGRMWYTIDTTQAAQQLNQPRKRIIAALNYLDEQRLITLKTEKARRLYRFLKTPDDRQLLIQKLTDKFRNSEKNNIERVQHLARISASGECLVRTILNYFGEDLGHNCGHCSSCEGSGPQIFARQAGSITDQHAELIRNLVAENYESLATPRKLSRYLAGMTSPKATRERLTRRSEFGLLAKVSFNEIMTFAESLIK